MKKANTHNNWLLTGMRESMKSIVESIRRKKKMAEGGMLEDSDMDTQLPDSDDKPEGMLGMDAKTIVKNLRRMAEGGEVKPTPTPQPSSTPLESAQDSMRKAFHFAEGGEVDANEDNISEHEVNSQAVDDDQLSQDINTHMPEDLSHASNEIQPEDEDDQKKGRLDRIMSMIHSKHYGKR